MNDVSGDADSRGEQLRERTPTRPGGERQAPTAHEAEVEKPAEAGDIVQEASDDSFPASDPPST